MRALGVRSGKEVSEERSLVPFRVPSIRTSPETSPDGVLLWPRYLSTNESRSAGEAFLRNRRVCHQRGTLVYGKRTRPDSAQRKQRNRPSRAHMKKWRSIGCYSPD
jgi:hypothetical protein